MIDTIHIVVAMKPLSGNFVQNAQKHGVAGLNIDGCRIGTTKSVPASASRTSGNSGSLRNETGAESGHDPNVGRWPANLIHDGSDVVLAGFPVANSTRVSGNPNNPRHGSNNRRATSYDWNPETESGDYRDSGSAARFFKQVKT